MALDDLAAAFATVGARLTAAAAALPVADPGASAFGGGATGRLGELGRELHRGYVAALDARAREAAAHGARLSAAADSLARAAAAYADTDEAARRRGIR
jgi:hypothetical protein